MNRHISIVAILLISVASAAQQPPIASPLLDRLVGHWVLRGEIAGKETIHDVEADWVIQHHYLRLHEVSREKDAKGQPQYEAAVFIGQSSTSKAYTCVWLDVFGGSSIASIGVAEPSENEFPFIFKDEKGDVSFRNDFIYDAATTAWEWRMDNVVKGVAKPFGRVKLTRS
jgi:hypothetical protein